MWRVIATDRDGREIGRREIDVGEITLGRDADRMMVLQSPSVSRRHCRVRADQNGVTITDDGSANGIVINGTRIPPNAPTGIPPGTRVEIAEFRLIVEQVGPPPQMAPPPMMMQPPQMAPPPMMMQPPQMAPPQMMQPPMSMQPPMMGGMQPMAGASAVVPPGGAMGGPVPGDMVRLIAEGGQYNGRVFDLPQLGEISVGRGVGNDLVLDDPSMSRKHSKMKRLGGGRLEVEDLNSANGTYVNGRKITTTQLGPGDTLRFGEVMFRVDGAGGASPRQPMDPGVISLSAPPWMKGAFLGIAGVAGLVWLIWIIKLILPSAPAKGVVEAAIAKKIQEADVQVRAAQEAFNKREWQKAKEAAEAAQEIDPANLEANRVLAQARRANFDEGKYREGIREIDKDTSDGFTNAMRIFDEMSPDSSYRQEFADKLRSKLLSAGENFYRAKKYRDSAELLCNAYRVAPASQKPGANTIKMLRDAEKKARMSSTCTLK